MKHLARRERHAPLAARLLLAGPVILGGAALVIVGLAIGGRAGLIVSGLAVAAAGTVVVLCMRTALVIEGGELVARNPFRSRRLAASDVVELRPERLAGLLGPLGTEVGVVRRGGAVIRVAATLSLVGTGRGAARAGLFLALRRWAVAHAVPDRLPRHEFATAGTRHDLLTGGEEVEVRGRMRRTDARGWDDWDTGRLVLPAVGSSQPSTWVSDEAHGEAHVEPARGRPVDLIGAEKVARRGVRFPEEAFFGKNTGFLVITLVRRTVELAFPEEEADLVLARLRQLEGHEGGGSLEPRSSHDAPEAVSAAAPVEPDAS